jgi:protein-tyrosine phosphatase
VGFTDLHSHVLPGLDDGAQDLDTSRAMLGGLAALGFDTVVATPHQKASQFLPELDAIRTAHAEVVAMAEAEDMALRLALAAENMWDDVFYRRAEIEEIPSYDDGPAFLLEFPLGPQLPVGVFELLFKLRMKGRLPVIAHPERYEPLWKDESLVDKLRRECALVIDLGAVAGYHGRKQGKVARAWLKKGLAHAVASDAHSIADVQVAAEGMAWIRKKLGQRELDRLLGDGPAQILAGEHPE